MAQLRCVLFDLNGTLLDPGGIGEPLGLSRTHSLEALDEAVLLAMAETLSGGYRPLPEFVRAALARRGGPDGIDAAMERVAQMPAYPDAREAIELLGRAGMDVGVLTNSATEAGEAALEAAGLRNGLSLVVGTDQVQAFKPDRRVYRLGCERAGCEPAAVCMVAAHGWDLMGAGRAGMRTAWVARKEGRLADVVPEPDLRGATLLDAAAGIAAEVAGRVDNGK